MPHKLYWNTVNPLLKHTLRQLMNCEIFDAFRLVGRTALSLQLGHRISVDIDLFTDSPYSSIDFKEIDRYLRNNFSYVSDSGIDIIAMGSSYNVGENERDAVKIDLYYTDTFIQPAYIVEGIRMATVEEIIAMKMDVVQRGARKKDFWDLHEVMDRYSLDQMIKLHQERYPYSHDEKLIRLNIRSFEMADEDFDPVCLRDKHWELIKYEIVHFLT
ncbi:nucleotidyl transferase AbiEii/AbiGii toxin family protein [Chitinophaga qingshengii]|uniref:Nucleotidyl transferase AbiEii/AbiGii toxin family protein n=1 Tax=Chitinophaga qingshengii TaxID=1569794 RepID=A0ABR7TP59_9BACT|nr:nucleotidyl transferase AbiEii/AbiGii toxin family protein [Chitinophaga qingshengii]MBC9931214.1 nucleotidyl transferase AbiEii/AbiGii toxin family protein [Chitinophaga qingshengii]